MAVKRLHKKENVEARENLDKMNKINAIDGVETTYSRRESLKANGFRWDGHKWNIKSYSKKDVNELAELLGNLGLSCQINDGGRIYASYKIKGSVMRRAWQIAKKAARRFGGSSRQYLSESLKEAHKEAKKAVA